MGPELALIALLVASAAVSGLLALRRTGVVARIRLALHELDGLTAEDDGERM